MNIRKLRCGRNRSRKAASEIMGAILMVGVTLAVGFSAWAWVSGAARVAESNLNSVSVENFKIVNANFTGTKVTLEIYDVSTATANLTSIIITNSTSGGSHPLTYTNSTLVPTMTGGPNDKCKKCVTLSGQTITLVTLNIGQSFTSGSIYTFKVTGQYGTVVQYQQAR